MKRLTFEGNFCDIAMCSATPGGSFCEDGYCSQRKVWERLKEYEDRAEQGCEYCTMEHDIMLQTDMGYTWISGNELQNSYGSCVIEFCPMCGRKLGGADHE